MHIDLSKVANAISHSFVICHGDSNTQVNAIAESVEKETIEQFEIAPYSIQGTQNAEWVLLDYGDTVVHVFQKSVRNHYKLEELWADGRVTHIDEINSHIFDER